MVDIAQNFFENDADNLAINIATFNDTKIVLKDGEIMNPFFVALNKSQLDTIKKQDLYSQYKHLYVLCMAEHMEFQKDVTHIYDCVTTKEQLHILSGNFSLLKMPIKLLSNKHFYERALFVNSDILSLFNIDDYKLEKMEIVIPMFELTETQAQQHCELYQSSVTIKQIINNISINNYYNNDYTLRTNKQLSEMILSLKESDYWTHKHNCNFNITEKFVARTFWTKNANTHIANGHLKKTIQKIIDPSVKLAYFLPSSETHETYVDVASALQNQKDRTYYATVDNGKLQITKPEITQLFRNSATEKERYDLFNTLLISKEYCHMVLNNVEVLSIMKETINKFLPLYKYLLAYAWIAFYTEECIFKTKTTKESRYVFDITTANKLPMFPFANEDVTQNPYIALLVTDSVLNLNRNNMSHGCYVNYKNRSIDTLDRFKWKFNLFTTGDAKRNIFTGLEWGSKYAVSGSIIPAFSITRPMLVDLVTKAGMTEDEQWLAFFKQYYGSSDIDFMVYEKSIFDFMIDTVNVISVIETNINDKLIITPIKSSCVIICSQYINYKLEDIREFSAIPDLTLEDVQNALARGKSNDYSQVIREYFYNLYTDIKRKNNAAQRKVHQQYRTNQIFNSYYEPVSINDLRIVISAFDADNLNERDWETTICVNDIELNKVPQKNNTILLRVCESIRYKLSSPKLTHCVEVFKTSQPDFFSTVARFHLPCVRGYYNGDNVYLLSSCVTALMTGINIDYKYFAGTSHPRAILNKYNERGFGTPLNKKELEDFMIASMNDPITKQMFKIHIDDDATKLLGFKDINHPMFKPLHFKSQMPLSEYSTMSAKNITTVAELKQIYKTMGHENCIFDMLFNLKAIQGGSITPLRKWIISAYWNMLMEN